MERVSERRTQGKGKGREEKTAAGGQKQASGIGAKEKDLRREMREASRVGSGYQAMRATGCNFKVSCPEIVDRANPHPEREGAHT